MGDIMALY